MADRPSIKEVPQETLTVEITLDYNIGYKIGWGRIIGTVPAIEGIEIYHFSTMYARDHTDWVWLPSLGELRYWLVPHIKVKDLPFLKETL